MFGRILSGLFSKKEIIKTDFKEVFIDMHSHLIPGIDDGAVTIDDSIFLLRELHNLGFRKFITTPHIMNDFYKNTPEIIHDGLEKIKEAISNDDQLKDVEIKAAAEYYLDDGFVKKLEKNQLLTMGDNYVLLELSYMNYPDQFEEVIQITQKAGYRLILAHPERYPFWYKDFDGYRRIKDMNVCFQLNINSLCGHYNQGVKVIAQKLVDNDLIDFIGTDTHNMSHIASLKKCTTEPYLLKLIESGCLQNKYLFDEKTI